MNMKNELHWPSKMEGGGGVVWNDIKMVKCRHGKNLLLFEIIFKRNHFFRRPVEDDSGAMGWDKVFSLFIGSLKE